MKTPRRPSPSRSAFVAVAMLVVVTLACSFPGLTAPTPIPPPPAATLTFTFTPPPLVTPPTNTEAPTLTASPSPSPTTEPPTPTIAVPHALIPSTSVDVGKLIYDATCIDTAAEKRAPFGDSYKTNLFERPFTQDMTYVADLDIVSYNLSRDEKFYYVSIQLLGSNPNNALGIDYAVELDLDADGFGDVIIVAHPPYKVEWSTDNVQVALDTDHDTGGLSAARSDAPLPGNGYDKIIFDRGLGDDHDLAWVRINAGKLATVQFAFKIPLAENRFMYGVRADAGLRDITELDYVDRYTEEEAGSPQAEEKLYPLKAIYAVDNTCRDAYGFVGNYEEPQRCPKK
ncbi:MAG: hypothetical protein ACOY0R_02320 [Chloroflexota bacterium]